MSELMLDVAMAALFGLKVYLFFLNWGTFSFVQHFDEDFHANFFIL
ncbi:hypothetical protein ES319_A12G174800v1 [Gossypium barbadense]|uniref:Uncharacterized protein n=1 Tax=Gossypium barbadense TaxID=3634 RepID=A0A5J5TCI9_GOSBA|nr:hypothetical protein ES319_A12G174800v1 [Gossypium barbadense]